MPAIVEQIISILISGLTTIAAGIGGGLQALVESVFLNEQGQLSNFGGVVAVFGGVSLAVGLSTMVVKWIMSLGARN